MTKCWPEGDLRAYLDRELSTGDMQEVAAHLGECQACDMLCTELASRASRVSALMDLLPEFEAPRPRPVAVAARPQQHRWVPYAVALAACLALLAYLKPKPVEPAAGPRTEPVIASNPPQPVAPAETPVLAPVLAGGQSPRPVRQVRKTATPDMTFVALDDEPFESGIIMRVDVKPGNLQADVVFGPDGRAHAFRLVNASNPRVTRY